jgi:hypothetical protein
MRQRSSSILFRLVLSRVCRSSNLIRIAAIARRAASSAPAKSRLHLAQLATQRVAVAQGPTTTPRLLAPSHPSETLTTVQQPDRPVVSIAHRLLWPCCCALRPSAAPASALTSHGLHEQHTTVDHGAPTPLPTRCTARLLHRSASHACSSNRSTVAAAADYVWGCRAAVTLTAERTGTSRKVTLNSSRSFPDHHHSSANDGSSGPRPVPEQHQPAAMEC